MLFLVAKMVQKTVQFPASAENFAFSLPQG